MLYRVPVFLPHYPLALRAEPFPGCDRGQRSDNRRLVVESDALDDAGDFLGRGPAFRDCGIHAWGFIFTRMI